MTPPTASPSAVMVLLFVRGVLLWLVIPLAAVAWLLTWPVMRARQIGLGLVVGWADLNLIAFIQRSLLRPAYPQPMGWTPFCELPAVTHRVRLIDPL